MSVRELAAVQQLTWGYEVLPVEASSVLCQGRGCDRQARCHVVFVADDRAVAEKLLCRGHAPVEDRTYRTAAA